MKGTAKKGAATLVIIAVIVAILLVGGFVVFQGLQQKNLNTKNAPAEISENDTFGWKSYSNLDFNFTIDYPSDYEYREFDNEKDLGVLTVSFSPKGELDALNTIILKAAKQKTSQAIEDLKAKVVADPSVKNLKSTQVAGKPALAFELPPEQGIVTIEATLLLSSNLVLELRHTRGYSVDIYNKMLNSAEL